MHFLHTTSPACCARTQTHSRQPAYASCCCPCVFQRCPFARVFAHHTFTSRGERRVSGQVLHRETTGSEASSRALQERVRLCRVDGSRLSAHTLGLRSRFRSFKVTTALRPTASATAKTPRRRKSTSTLSSYLPAARQPAATRPAARHTWLTHLCRFEPPENGVRT